MSLNQNQFVLNHLIDHGYITQTIANNYGIRRLASRIHDLTVNGVAVRKEMRKDDMGVRYAYYAFANEAVQAAERRRRDAGSDYRDATAARMYRDEVLARKAA